jgi:hypothetical protein
MSPASAISALIGVLDPSRMTDEEIAAVWTLILYLRRRETAGRPMLSADLGLSDPAAARAP